MSLPDLGIDWDDRNLWIALMVAVINPIYWNFAARLNHKTKFLERLLGSGKRVVIFFAVTIILLGSYRTYRFHLVLNSQPINPSLDDEILYCVGWSLTILGSILWLSSLCALGFYATFFGDYCGVRLQRRITAFPYSIFNDPMYIGDSFYYFGVALIYKSDSAILISLVTSLVFIVASIYEDDFTRLIYKSVEKKKRKKKRS